MFVSQVLNKYIFFTHFTLFGLQLWHMDNIDGTFSEGRELTLGPASFSIMWGFVNWR